MSHDFEKLDAFMRTHATSAPVPTGELKLPVRYGVWGKSMLTMSLLAIFSWGVFDYRQERVQDELYLEEAMRLDFMVDETTEDMASFEDIPVLP